VSCDWLWLCWLAGSSGMSVSMRACIRRHYPWADRCDIPTRVQTHATNPLIVRPERRP
jgi:hypothetical protein